MEERAVGRAGLVWITLAALGAQNCGGSSLPLQSSEGVGKRKSVEVTFQDGEHTLSGTLLEPEGSGPFPVIVWCHGSGKSSRQWGLAYAGPFLQCGYAFLAWDKIGTGKSNGIFYKQSFTERAEETRSAVEMLKERRDIDRKRIGFSGASQAGYVLPKVIRDFPQAELLVLLSPGIFTLEEEFAYQTKVKALERLLPQFGVKDPTEIEEIVRFAQNWMRLIVEDANPQDRIALYQEVKERPWFAKVNALGVFVDPAIVAEKEKLFFQQARQFDAVEEYSWISCPTLVLLGENDECLDPIVADERIRRAFERSGNKPLTVRRYPGANHGLVVDGKKVFEKDLKDWLADHGHRTR